mgnify:FL=1
MTNATELRKAIIAAHLETSSAGEAPEPATLYIPPSHHKALRLDAHVVVGARGVGKSFWTAALRSEELRATLGSTMPELDQIKVDIGFSEQEAIHDYPNADTFNKLHGDQVDAYDTWRAVILRWIAKHQDMSVPSDSWSDTVAWLKHSPEAAANLMQTSRNWRGLIVFDALDRTSGDWMRMDEIVRGLLRALLWLRPFPGLSGKVFLREDQAERTVFNFPDASKLVATKTELAWARHDLHGLLWQRLINAPEPNGKLLRDICKAVLQKELYAEDDIWRLPDELKRETAEQRMVFEKIAGAWMGTNAKRGVPYTWSVGHLADGRGQTSPRSFLAAIRQAAEDTQERYPDASHALHYESIKRGIQKASEIRVAEIAEDYPWVPDVLSVLRGMNVPCEYSAILEYWQQHYPDGPQGIRLDRLPPQHAERGWDGVRDDLIRIGLIELRKDGRIDMPDLYRVGFGLGRKGGVKPKSVLKH